MEISMISFGQAFILGLVQGLTEYLPISSSAHLVLVQYFLGLHDKMLFFDIVLHLGTLVALFVYFAADIAHIIRDSIYGFFFLLQRKPVAKIKDSAPSSYWAFGVIAASVPTALIGFLFKHQLEAMFGSIKTLGYELLITTVILWLTRRFQEGKKSVQEAGILDFLLIGTLQGVAIVPGISRSGVTIAAGLFLGLKREEAFRFSFLLAIPAILGAAVLEFKEGLSILTSQWPVYGVGFIAAAVSGFASIAVLSVIIRREKFHLFAWYTLAMSALVFFFR